MRKNQGAPMMAWLTGHQELLFVEIDAANAHSHKQRTSSGVRLPNEGKVQGDVSQEVWAWGDVNDNGSASAGALKHTNDRLSFKVGAATELTLRVLGRHEDWSNTAVPLELLGEARFQIDDDVLPAMLGGDGLLSLPLLLDGRIRGMVSLMARAILEDGPPPVSRAPSRKDSTEEEIITSGKTDRLVRLKGHSVACEERVLLRHMELAAWAEARRV